jgi:hypothetical protein
MFGSMEKVSGSSKDTRPTLFQAVKLDTKFFFQLRWEKVLGINWGKKLVHFGKFEKKNNLVHDLQVYSCDLLT